MILRIYLSSFSLHAGVWVQGLFIYPGNVFLFFGPVLCCHPLGYFSFCKLTRHILPQQLEQISYHSAQQVLLQSECICGSCLGVVVQGKWVHGFELFNTGPRELSLLLLLLLLFSCHLNVFHSKCLNVTSYLFGSLTLFLKLYELPIPTKLSGHLFTMFYNYPHSRGEPVSVQYSVCHAEHNFLSTPGQLLWLSSTATPSQMPFTLLSPPYHSYTFLHFLKM